MDLAAYQETLFKRAPSFKSERAELISRFLGKGIMVFKSGKLVEADARTIAFKLSHIPTEDLHAFHEQCSRAKSFSKYFYWSLKPQA
jgi:hypothetical protein